MATYVATQREHKRSLKGCPKVAVGKSRDKRDAAHGQSPREFEPEGLAEPSSGKSPDSFLRPFQGRGGWGRCDPVAAPARGGLATGYYMAGFQPALYAPRCIPADCRPVLHCEQRNRNVRRDKD